MKEIIKNKYALKFSYIAIILIVSHSLLFNDFWKSWKHNETQFVWDVGNYYSYLPATFIHHDLKFNYPHSYWLITAPNGAKVQKGTCGMAIMYMPFFLIGHKIAINTKVPLDGFSGPYSDMIRYGTIFYSLIAFFFLEKILSRFFKDSVVAITLLCIFFGTNLFYYTLGEGEMTHSYLFCLFGLLLWLIIKWHETFKLKYTIFIGLVIGLITLIRPTEIMVSLVFIFYDVISFQSLKDKLRLLFIKKWPHLLVMVFFGLLVLSPQLIYWKWLTGNFLFFSYGTEERFFWGDPMFSKVLFGWRKGWLIYTPIMIFSLIGLFFGKKYFPKLNFAFKIYLLINLYIICSWWCWWYGGSFGMRAMIQSYCFFAFFFAAFIDKILTMEWKFKLPELAVKYITLILLCCFVYVNLIQTYQYNKHMIHFEAMTKEAYWITFCKFEHTGKDPEKYWGAVKGIDYPRAQKGDRDQ